MQQRVVFGRPKFKLGAVEVIIGINIFLLIPVLLGMIGMNKLSQNLFGYLALNFNMPFQNYNTGGINLQNGAIWQLLTSVFLHGGFFHLLFNMYALYIFGKPLEMRWGKMRFVIFYLAVGILANVGSVIVFYITDMLTANPVTITMVGASGAVFGVLLAFGGYFPEARLLLFFFIPLKVKWLVLLYAAIEIVSEISNTIGVFSDRIAHMTHLFGFLFAFLYLLLFHKMNAIKEMYFPNKNRFYYQ